MCIGRRCSALGVSFRFTGGTGPGTASLAPPRRTVLREVRGSRVEVAVAQLLPPAGSTPPERDPRVRDVASHQVVVQRVDLAGPASERDLAARMLGCGSSGLEGELGGRARSGPGLVRGRRRRVLYPRARRPRWWPPARPAPTNRAIFGAVHRRRPSPPSTAGPRHTSDSPPPPTGPTPCTCGPGPTSSGGLNRFGTSLSDRVGRGATAPKAAPPDQLRHLHRVKA